MNFHGIHFCPTELAVIMMVIDHVKVYLYHYKHIVMSAFTKWNDPDCEVCQENE